MIDQHITPLHEHHYIWFKNISEALIYKLYILGQDRRTIPQTGRVSLVSEPRCEYIRAKTLPPELCFCYCAFTAYIVHKFDYLKCSCLNSCCNKSTFNKVQATTLYLIQNMLYFSTNMLLHTNLQNYYCVITIYIIHVVHMSITPLHTTSTSRAVGQISRTSSNHCAIIVYK